MAKSAFIDPDNKLMPPGRRPTLISKAAAYILLIIVVIPIYSIVLLLILVILAITTITGIGPLLEYMKKKRDDKILDQQYILQKHPEMSLIEIPEHINSASNGKKYKVMVRVTRPKDSTHNYPPVICPGGLAATLVATAKMQDELTTHGFTVVTFDRYGVGFSDENINNLSPSAIDVAREMEYIMRITLPPNDNRQWICIGGSMGTIVAEAYMSIYPNRICGLLNLDGMTHGIIKDSTPLFLGTYAPIYGLEALLVWTGCLRFLFSMIEKSLLKVFHNESFGPELLAQMCRKRFFYNTKLEFFTMFSCCDLVNTAWGRYATTLMDTDTMYFWCCIPPKVSYIIDNTEGISRTETTERGRSELGDRWLTPEEVKEGLTAIKTFRKSVIEDIMQYSPNTGCNWPRHPVGDQIGGRASTDIIYPLAPQFAQMVVRVMSGRAYDMGDDIFGEWAYPQTLRNVFSAEHNKHALLARDGARIIYPKLTHLKVFAQVSEIVLYTKEIAGIVTSFNTTV